MKYQAATETGIAARVKMSDGLRKRSTNHSENIARRISPSWRRRIAAARKAPQANAFLQCLVSVDRCACETARSTKKRYEGSTQYEDVSQICVQKIASSRAEMLPAISLYIGRTARLMAGMDPNPNARLISLASRTGLFQRRIKVPRKYQWACGQTPESPVHA